MRSRPLYPEEPVSPVSTGAELDIDRGCSRCKLGALARHPCLPADGTPGGVVFIGKHPGKVEDTAGRAHVGQSGKTLREIVGRHWTGPAVYDNVVRCFPGQGRSLPANSITECRPYLRRILRQARPQRIIALGAEAALGLVGRSVPVMSVRSGYAWTRMPDGALVPVFFVPHPAAGERNPTLQRFIEDDIAFALRRPVPIRPPWAASYHLVETPDDAAAAVADIRDEAPWCAYDLEWSGVPFTRFFEVVTAAVCSSGTDEPYVWSRNALHDPATRRPLLDLLADPAVGKVGHNIKSDNQSVYAAWGVQVRGTYGDTRLWRRLLCADVNAKLDVCAELVGMGGHKEENESWLEKAVAAIRDRRRDRKSRQEAMFEGNDPALLAAVAAPDEDPKRFAFALIPPEVRDRYCARDAVATARLGDMEERQLDADPPIRRVWTSIVHRATDAVEQMERWGIAADRAAMGQFDAYLGMEIEQVSRRLATYGTFNPASAADVSRLLFDELKLKPLAMTSSGDRPSTDKEVLKRLRYDHPVVGDIIEYRRLEKLRSNYGLKMAAFVRMDGRIHPELKIDGAETGRLSCVNPPLHQIPRSFTAEGKMIKRCFVAPPGYLILNADYSQIELRTAAFLSGDPVMIAMFQSGEDFHLATAKLICEAYWGIKASAVEDKHRTQAKSFNFGLLYGMTDRGLAKRLGCSVADASRLRAAIMGKWKRLAVWMHERITSTRKTGYARTWWDGADARRRPLFGIRSTDNLQRSNAENSAINTPVQGTASDFMLSSICALVEWVLRDGLPAKVVLTVHDSVVFEVRADAVDDLAVGALDIMLAHNSLAVPLRVDVEVGQTLGDMDEWQQPGAAAQ